MWWMAPLKSLVIALRRGGRSGEPVPPPQPVSENYPMAPSPFLHHWHQVLTMGKGSSFYFFGKSLPISRVIWGVLSRKLVSNHQCPERSPTQEIQSLLGQVTAAVPEQSFCTTDGRGILVPLLIHSNIQVVALARSSLARQVPSLVTWLEPQCLK